MSSRFLMMKMQNETVHVLSLLLLFEKLSDGFRFILRNIVQQRKAEEIKDVIHFWRHVGEFNIAVVFPNVFNKRHKYTETGAADIRQIFAVHDDAVFPSIEKALKRLFQVWCCVGIKIPFQVNDLNSLGFPHIDLEITHT